MLRAIWRASVVLPDPWAPPIRKQLARAQSAADGLVEGHEAGGHRLEVTDLAFGHALIQVGEDLERAAGVEADAVRLELPVHLGGRLTGDSAGDSAGDSSIMGKVGLAVVPCSGQVPGRTGGEYTTTRSPIGMGR